MIAPELAPTSQAEGLRLPPTAIVHDYFVQDGGAERVAIEFARMFPRASIYTSVFDAGVFGSRISVDRVRSWPPLTSRLIGPRFRVLALAYAAYFDQLRPTTDSDNRRLELVISSSSAFTKAVRSPRGAFHAAYVYSPMRFAWDPESYLDGSHAPRLLQASLRASAPLLRRWDRSTARRPDLVIAISRTVRDRIGEVWDRDAEVIYPPVDTHEFAHANADPEDYYLVAARMLAYRRIADAVRACTNLGRRLVVIGDGPERVHLHDLGGPTVTFLGRVSRPELVHHVLRCRAYLVPGVEDFGIAPVEAMAAGRPVITVGQGGGAETVLDGVTGVHYPSTGVDSLQNAILRFESMEFHTAAARARAEEFSLEQFQRRFMAALARAGAI